MNHSSPNYIGHNTYSVYDIPDCIVIQPIDISLLQYKGYTQSYLTSNTLEYNWRLSNILPIENDQFNNHIGSISYQLYSSTDGINYTGTDITSDYTGTELGIHYITYKITLISKNYTYTSPYYINSPTITDSDALKFTVIKNTCTIQYSSNGSFQYGTSFRQLKNATLSTAYGLTCPSGTFSYEMATTTLSNMTNFPSLTYVDMNSDSALTFIPDTSTNGSNTAYSMKVTFTPAELYSSHFSSKTSYYYFFMDPSYLSTNYSINYPNRIYGQPIDTTQFQTAYYYYYLDGVQTVVNGTVSYSVSCSQPSVTTLNAISNVDNYWIYSSFIPNDTMRFRNAYNSASVYFNVSIATPVLTYDNISVGYGTLLTNSVIHTLIARNPYNNSIIPGTTVYQISGNGLSLSPINTSTYYTVGDYTITATFTATNTTNYQSNISISNTLSILKINPVWSWNTSLTPLTYPSPLTSSYFNVSAVDPYNTSTVIGTIRYDYKVGDVLESDAYTGAKYITATLTVSNPNYNSGSYTLRNRIQINQASINIQFTIPSIVCTLAYGNYLNKNQYMTAVASAPGLNNVTLTTSNGSLRGTFHYYLDGDSELFYSNHYLNAGTHDINVLFIPDSPYHHNNYSNVYYTNSRVLTITPVRPPSFIWNSYLPTVAHNTLMTSDYLNASLKNPYYDYYIPNSGIHIGTISYSVLNNNYQTVTVTNGSKLDSGTHTIQATLTVTNSNFIIPTILIASNKITVLPAVVSVNYYNPYPIPKGASIPNTVKNLVTDYPNATIQYTVDDTTDTNKTTIFAEVINITDPNYSDVKSGRTIDIIRY
jgi:hypothetical protein